MAGFTIRRATDADGDAIYTLFRAVARDGLAFMHEEADVQRGPLLAKWLNPEYLTYVAELVDGRIGGAYCVLPNQPGRGRHVANATYMVAEAVRGQGIGRALGLHSLDMARAAGFDAMQFNAVISTNTAAVDLWRGLGFAVIGTVPGGFRQPDGRCVDVYIMHRAL
ncbi:MAG: N-acetyltransferase family protein [Chloroflexota bacterium]